MTKSAQYWIKKLNLDKHPEGGWFKEIYRSTELVGKNALPKDFSGSGISLLRFIIYWKEMIFLLFTGLNRMKSGIITMEIQLSKFYTIENGKLKRYYCGNNPDKNEQLQVIVPKNTWFAARLVNQQEFALAGCTVSPGFHFDDFEMAGEELLEEYPELESEIRELIRLK